MNKLILILSITSCAFTVFYAGYLIGNTNGSNKTIINVVNTNEEGTMTLGDTYTISAVQTSTVYCRLCNQEIKTKQQ